MKKHSARRAANWAARKIATPKNPPSKQHKTSPQLISWEEVIGKR
jgi:hypothetical protein